MDTLTFYQQRLTKRWRWRYQSAGNRAKMANGGESYSKLSDCVRAAFRVCGLPNQYESNACEIVSGCTDKVLTRDNGFDVEVRFR